jgi:hypothetical protein
MKFGLASTIACVGSLLLAGGAKAADVYSPVTPESQQVVTEQGWTFTVAPYFWAAGISGDVGQFGLPPVEVDASFSDIFDHLDFGAMAIGEARYDRYSIFGDIMYTKISGSNGTPRGILATSVEVSTETFAGLIGAGYALLEEITEQTRAAVGAWIARRRLAETDFLFPSRPSQTAHVDEAVWKDCRQMGLQYRAQPKAIRNTFDETDQGITNLQEDGQHPRRPAATR